MTFKPSWRPLGKLLLAAILMTMAFNSIRSPAAEFEVLKGDLRTNGKSTVSALALAIDPNRDSVVQILCDNQLVALGTVVSSDGWIVTKASVLEYHLEVKTSDGRSYVPEAVRADRANDLALLRINADHLQPIHWSDSEQLDSGQLVIAPRLTAKRYRLGIISAKSRSIDRSGGALGIGLSTVRSDLVGVRIREVFEDTPAYQAGLKPGDIINAVNQKTVNQFDALTELIRSHEPGETVRLTVTRDDQELTFDVELGYRSKIVDQRFQRRFNRSQRLSGETSRRRTDFPEIIQHDIPLHPDAMGGPLSTLDGKVIGINIAIVDRVTTFALPSKLVQDLVNKLK